ncbi:ABC transporter substrate-binding protein [Telmatospirillum sp. J64-1]|uniref:ABC transporter substrate-binding protein n=1 Tax=Telmatospirillum sp. J64-1 TaxID=2502183 RepID=UPI001C8F6F55|nr:ABC transporter substrate-binding protein [Telmatospirillum sp. J64-1]
MNRIKTAIASFGIAAGMVVGAQGAMAQNVPVKLTLDWKFEGPAAPFLVAAEKGYFAEEGINITIDSGNGSSGAVTRVASGAYDIALADINSLIEFNDQNPGNKLQAIFVVYDVAPFAIFSLKKTGIDSPAELSGKTLGAPVFDAPRKLFPAFAQAVGVDVGAVTWKSMDPPLREPMLVRGDVDAISGFYFTSLLNLKAQGIKEEDLNVFHYADSGLSLYSNAVIPSAKMKAEHPEALKGFLRAVARGWADVIADPEAGIQAVKKRDPLINEALELERLHMVINNNVLTDDVKANGMGGVTEARLAANIELVTLGFGLSRKPDLNEVFDDSFMPAKEERMLTR